MQAEYSVELAADDPTLAVPWTDPEARWHYVDLRAHPEQIDQLEEAQTFAEIRDFLVMLNANPSAFGTAKCDAWFSEELTEEESTFGAQCKFGSYVDIFFRHQDFQTSLEQHEAFLDAMVRLLRVAPEIPASFEGILRRADFAEAAPVIRRGFYCTLYVYGYGDEEMSARQAWGIAMRLVGNACFQLSGRSFVHPHS
jgi:hypothetical protein